MFRNDFFWSFLFFSIVSLLILFPLEDSLDNVALETLEFLPWLESVPSIESIFLYADKELEYLLSFLANHLLMIVVASYLVFIRRSKDIAFRYQFTGLKMWSIILALFPGIYLCTFYLAFYVPNEYPQNNQSKVTVLILRNEYIYTVFLSIISVFNTYTIAAFFNYFSQRTDEE